MGRCCDGCMAYMVDNVPQTSGLCEWTNEPIDQ